MSAAMATLAVFVEARLAELERWALAASGEYGRTATLPEHWRWECTHDDEPLDPELAIASNEEHLIHDHGPDGEWFRIGLRSTEEYPSRVQGMGPLVHLVLHDAEELEPSVARFIAAMDPARAVAIVEAGRHLLGWAGALPTMGRYYVLDAFAHIWADHPEHPNREETA